MDDKTWDKVFGMFCFGFQEALKRWAKKDFDEDEANEVFQRLKAWIAAGDGYWCVLHHEWEEEE